MICKGCGKQLTGRTYMTPPEGDRYCSKECIVKDALRIYHGLGGGRGAEGRIRRNLERGAGMFLNPYSP